VIHADPDSLAVEIEVEGACPAHWVVAGNLPRRLRSDNQRGKRSKVALEHGQVELAPDVRRIRYTCPVVANVRKRGHHSLERGAGERGSYMLEGSAYLLVPRGLPPGSTISVRYKGLEALLPWVLTKGRVVLEPHDLNNLGHHGFGLRRHTLEVGEGRLEVGVVAGELACDDKLLCAWLRQAAQEVVSARPQGSAPHPRLQVLLVPAPGTAEVSPFGRVLWSRPQSVALYIGQHADAGELHDDWTAVHELSHTLHPRIVPHATWLTEGVATYYQTLTRIRSGRRSADAMWGAMAWGLRDGQDHGGRRSLRYLSKHLHELHAYGPVYWGGAFLMFELDLELRRQSRGSASLDCVLKRALARGRPLNVEEFGQVVDEVAGQPLWRRVSEAHLDGPLLERGSALLELIGYDAGGKDLAPTREDPRLQLRSRLGGAADPGKDLCEGN
jgi:hypothetical protein